jgi:type II secretory pathway component GspD/PulD (secretin)|tara:strand:- start:942 stop:1214 length:273 start_codon:yes stop_codon:yes gene_type:complete
MEDLNWDFVLSNNDVLMITSETKIKEFLKELGNEMDDETFIIDDKKKRVISQDESEIKFSDLGSISSGSKNFIKDNLASYVEFLSQKRNL